YAEVEARPFADGALNPQASAMRFHNMAGNREAQAVPASRPGTRGVYPIEAFENSLLLHFRDSDAGISNRDDHTAVGTGGGHLDFSSRRRILQRVIEEILQYLLEAIGIPTDGWQSFRQTDVERELPGNGF